MIARIVAFASLTLVALPLPATAHPDDGALVGLHAKVRLGNRLCMADHFHQGQSSGHPTRKAAEVAAIRDWSGFTAWEYGSHWGNFQLAAARGASCSQSGGGWSCSVQARPCRRL